MGTIFAAFIASLVKTFNLFNRGIAGLDNLASAFEEVTKAADINAKTYVKETVLLNDKRIEELEDKVNSKYKVEQSTWKDLT